MNNESNINLNSGIINNFTRSRSEPNLGCIFERLVEISSIGEGRQVQHFFPAMLTNLQQSISLKEIEVSCEDNAVLSNLNNYFEKLDYHQKTAIFYVIEICLRSTNQEHIQYGLKFINLLIAADVLKEESFSESFRSMCKALCSISIEGIELWIKIEMIKTEYLVKLIEDIESAEMQMFETLKQAITANLSHDVSVFENPHYFPVDIFYLILEQMPLMNICRFALASKTCLNICSKYLFNRFVAALPMIVVDPISINKDWEGYLSFTNSISRLVEVRDKIHDINTIFSYVVSELQSQDNDRINKALALVKLLIDKNLLKFQFSSAFNDMINALSQLTMLSNDTVIKNAENVIDKFYSVRYFYLITNSPFRIFTKKFFISLELWFNFELIGIKASMPCMSFSKEKFLAHKELYLPESIKGIDFKKEFEQRFFEFVQFKAIPVVSDKDWDAYVWQSILTAEPTTMGSMISKNNKTEFLGYLYNQCFSDPESISNALYFTSTAYFLNGFMKDNPDMVKLYVPFNDKIVQGLIDILSKGPQYAFKFKNTAIQCIFGLLEKKLINQNASYFHDLLNQIIAHHGVNDLCKDCIVEILNQKLITVNSPCFNAMIDMLLLKLKKDSGKNNIENSLNIINTLLKLKILDNNSTDLSKLTKALIGALSNLYKRREYLDNNDYYNAIFLGERKEIKVQQRKIYDILFEIISRKLLMLDPFWCSDILNFAKKYYYGSSYGSSSNVGRFLLKLCLLEDKQFMNFFLPECSDAILRSILEELEQNEPRELEKLMAIIKDFIGSFDARYLIEYKLKSYREHHSEKTSKSKGHEICKEIQLYIQYKNSWLPLSWNAYRRQWPVSSDHILSYFS